MIGIKSSYIKVMNLITLVFIIFPLTTFNGRPYSLAKYYAEAVFAQSSTTPSDGPGPSLISINGRQIIVRKRNTDGTLAPPAPIIIRGAVWSPSRSTTVTSPDDVNNVITRRHEFELNAPVDIPLLKQMNVNTVYLPLDPELDATGRAVLDLLYNNGIMAIITVDNGKNDMSRVHDSVSFFKDHPAVLAWMLGNEWNINRYGQAGISPSAAAQLTENAAALIKTLDSNHPVATSYGDIDINGPELHLSDTQVYVNNTCHSVDLWGLNIYRGNTFGTLFKQWQLITNKPMFIGEFGTDAFRSFNVNPSPLVILSESLQAQWSLSEWNHLFKNLSASHPAMVANGGFFFEFNDEWWKVPPPNSQETGGYVGNHPDMFANEEYWGMVTIARQPRAIFAAFTGAYGAAYQASNSRTYQALSRGLTAQEVQFQNGVSRFYDNGQRFYERTGGGGGGRGFNVAVIDPCTGKPLQAVQHFDTWVDRNTTGNNMTAMIAFLNSLPTGSMILISVADEAGLNVDLSCNHLNQPWVQAGLQTLQNLGSQQVNNYCYQNSWAMTVVKGQGIVVPDEEQLRVADEATANLTQGVQATIFPSNRAFSFNAGNGAISVNAPGTCNWTVVNDNPELITVTSNSSGTGNGVVTYSVATNPNGVRTGTLTIAGQTFTLGQASSGRAGEDPRFDFDGDAKTDISVFRPSSANWYVLNSSNGLFSAQQLGQIGDIPVPADFDGDDKEDIGVFRPATGSWYWLNSSNGTFSSVQFGANGDLPVPEDFDGDHRADVAVYRPAAGSWYRLNSSNGQLVALQFGISEDVPALGDFDGDTRADIAIFRPSTGDWYRLDSSTGQFFGTHFGVFGDKPTPADYDGDGKVDLSVYRPSGGDWFRLNSSNGSFVGLHFGATGDKPVAADYDGDGKTDIAVFRPSNGTWYLLNSTAGFTAQQFGVAEDVPTPNAFVH